MASCIKRIVKRTSIRTSYFAKYRGNNGVSIALYTPKWFKGETYAPLNPSPSLLSKYKKGECTERYFERLYLEQLEKLDPMSVYNALKGKVLLCYEKLSDFCHRHLVAKWLEDNLNIKVREIDYV